MTRHRQPTWQHRRHSRLHAALVAVCVLAFCLGISVVAVRL